MRSFTSNTQAAIEASTFVLPTTCRKNNIPAEIICEIQFKNRLRREWQRCQDPAIKPRLNKKTAFIRLLLKTHEDDEWDKFLSSININDGSAFKLYKRLLKKSTLDHPLTGTHGPVYPATDKAEMFADTFQKQFTTNYEEAIPEVDLSIEQVHDSAIDHCSYITPGTVAQIIKHLPNRKSPGEDSITNIDLKNLPKAALLLLTRLFNGCLRIGYFPKIWKKVIIITIPKPGKNHSLPSSYRPIILLSSLSKAFERIIFGNWHQLSAIKSDRSSSRSELTIRQLNSWSN